MVKICPRCKAKNFDDARFCNTCTFNLLDGKLEFLPEKKPLPNMVDDKFTDFQPRGYSPEPWHGRIYSTYGLIFAALYFVFLFIYPLIFLLFIFSIVAIIFGGVGYFHNDTTIGKFTLGVGIILFLLTLVLFIIQYIHL